MQPAPVSTASMAAAIWSGVGEVNTWPGQAASSMPWPTKPACRGSWPEPPPDISATLPGLKRPSADEFPLGSQFDDVGVRGGKAIEAFVEHRIGRIHQLLHSDSSRLGRRSNAPASVLQQSRKARHVARVFRDQGVDRLVSPRVAQIGHGEA